MNEILLLIPSPKLIDISSFKELLSAMITFNALLLSSHLTILIYAIQNKKNDRETKKITENFGKELKLFFQTSLIISIISVSVSVFSFIINNEAIASYIMILIFIIFSIQLCILYKIINSSIKLTFLNRDDVTKKR